MSLYLKTVTKQCTHKILNQMENAFYNINLEDGKSNIGILCHIKHEDKTIPIIIINQLIKYGDINNTLNITANNQSIALELGEIKYKNRECNITILEIKENSENNLNYLEFDDILYKNEAKMYFYKDLIYIIHYNDENDVLVSYSNLKDINNNEIRYYNNINLKYKYSIIFNLYNNKIIGFNNKTSHNKGIFSKYIIDEFLNKYEYTNKFKNNKKYNYYQNVKNEIEILIKIEKSKKIYFLSNNIEANNDLKELNNENTSLYINNKQNTFRKYFRFTEIGEYKIKLKFNKYFQDCSHMFSGCEDLININLDNFNTKNVTNMKEMFSGCKNLKSINLFNLDTKNVIDMSGMFQLCSNLKSLELFQFNTLNVTNMENMFLGCENLINLNLSSFNTQNVSKMNFIFFLL